MRYRLILILLFMPVMFLSCGKDYSKRSKAADEAFFSGDYIGGAEKSLSNASPGGRDELLYLLEAGLMFHTGGEYRKSNQILFRAAELSEKIKISLSKQGTSILLNERSTNYRGENFERVLIHMYIGLNFFMLDNFESARVEFQKISRMLEQIKKAGGPDYEQNSMARYLTALCYESIGDTDNDFQAYEFAYIEYKKIYEHNKDLPVIKHDLVRLAEKLGDTEDLSLWKETFGRIQTEDHKNNGELVVIHQAGRGAYKVSRGSLLGDSNMRLAIMVSLNSMTLKEGVTVAAVLVALKNIEHPIPEYKGSENRIDHLALRISGSNKTVSTGIMENITTTARLSAENRYKTTRKKVAAGIAVKAATTYATSVVAEKITENTSAKDASKIIGFLTGAAVGTALASQIKPDLRCWHSLPANLQIGRITLPPGEYDILIDHVDKDGLAYKTEKRTVTIKKGNRTVINIRTLR